MARKFKVGDKVKIVKDIETKDNSNHNFRLGRVGVVDGINCKPDDTCPYRVQLRNKFDMVYFNPRELELIERKGNK